MKGYDMKSFSIKTNSQYEMLNITNQIQNIVYDSGILDGVVYIFVPHTTAAVTINEGADPSVMKDIIKEMDKIVPLRDNYLHMEGNSAAHIKSTLVGASEMVMIENGSLVLGTWQAIFFCEFDGSRQRKVLVKVMEG
jgi:secondary thiamine-phosphate synthase enzyme